MKTRIDVNLELRLQEYDWQHPDRSNQKCARYPARVEMREVRKAAQTGTPPDAVTRMH